MAKDMNVVMIIGRLTKDPELRTTQGGTSIASFSLANNYAYSSQNEKKELVSFFNCIAWGKPGEIIAQYGKKGGRLAVQGRLQQRSWQDKDGGKRNTVEIVVEGFQFLSAKQDGESSGSGESAGGAQYYAPADDSAPSHFSDEDIPF